MNNYGVPIKADRGSDRQKKIPDLYRAAGKNKMWVDDVRMTQSSET
jgi:hypothetical protein